MSVRYKAALIGTSALTLLGSTAAFAGEAQQAQAGAAIEEITVTARRVEENIQRVPITITAFTPEDLQQQDIKDLWTLQKQIVGLGVCCTGQGSANFLFMRGIQGVLSYFANAPINQAGFGFFFDVANIQILKGPQGTLFGISSNGGAILYEPRKPSDKLEGYVAVAGGDYGLRTIEGAVNIPVFEDKLMVRAAVQTSHRDGYVIDISTSTDLGDINYNVARLSATFRPTDSIENYFVYNYYKSHGRPVPFVPDAYNPAGLARSLFGPAAVDASLALQKSLGKYKIPGLSTALGKGGTRAWSYQHNFIDTLTWNISDNLALRNIFGYQLLRSFSVGDTDGSLFPILDGSGDNTAAPATPTWTEELQLQGKLFADRLNFTAGTFHTGSHNHPVIVRSINFGSGSAAITKNSNLTRAVYAQGTYDLSDDLLTGLSFTAGYRYTWDSIFQKNDRLTFATLQPNLRQVGEGHFHAGSYTFSLQYQYTPDTMFFITNSKGYKTGGLALSAPPQFRTFFPESLNNLEGGVKSTFDFGSWRIRTDLTGYYGWYDNVQTSVTQAVQVNPPPAPKSLQVVTQNAAKARIAGAEIQVIIIPNDYFEVGGSLAHMHNYYTSYPSLNAAGQPISLVGTVWTYTPGVKFNLNGTFHWPLDDKWGDVSLTASYTHTGLMYLPVELKSLAVANAPNDQNDPSSNLDVSVAWRSILQHDGLDATFYINNVMKNTIGEGNNGTYAPTVGIRGRIPAVPRMFGVRLQYSF